MGGGGGGSGSSQTTVVDPFIAIKPETANYLRKMKSLSGVSPSNFSGLNFKPSLSVDGAVLTYPAGSKTYADQNADELFGLDATRDRGRDGSQIITDGETLLQATFDGTKLNSNPTLDALFDKRKERLVQEFEEETIPRLDEQFNLQGRYASGAHHVAQAKAAESMMAKLSEIAMEVYGDGYWAERALQAQATALGIDYGTETIKDAELYRLAGLMKREYAEGALVDRYKRTRFEWDGAIKRLEIMGNGVRTVLGSYVATTEPVHIPSKTQEIAGIALASMGAISSIYGMSKGPASGKTPPESSLGGGGSGPSMSYPVPGSQVPHYGLG